MCQGPSVPCERQGPWGAQPLFAHPAVGGQTLCTGGDEMLLLPISPCPNPGLLYGLSLLNPFATSDSPAASRHSSLDVGAPCLLDLFPPSSPPPFAYCASCPIPPTPPGVLKVHSSSFTSNLLWGSRHHLVRSPLKLPFTLTIFARLDIHMNSVCLLGNCTLLTIFYLWLHGLKAMCILNPASRLVLSLVFSIFYRH